MNERCVHEVIRKIKQSLYLFLDKTQNNKVKNFHSFFFIV